MKRKEVEKLKQKEIELLEKIKEYDEETYKELIKECY